MLSRDMASMYSYNPACRQYNGRGEHRKSVKLLSDGNLFANIWLSKAAESRSIQRMYVLDQLVTLRPRRPVSKYLEREPA